MQFTWKSRIEHYIGVWASWPFALKLGVVLTYWLVTCFVGYFLLQLGEFRKLTPNEVGDFMAGAFAPLAFLWLLVAVLLQKQELEYQRQELRQSRAVLELQVREFQALVTESRRTGDLTQRDLDLRSDAATDSRICIEIQSLQERLRTLGSTAFVVSSVQGGTDYLFGTPGSEVGKDRDSITRAAIRHIGAFVLQNENADLTFDEAKDHEDLEHIHSMLDRLRDEIDEARHPTAFQKFSDLNLEDLRDSVYDVLNRTRAIK